MSGDPFLPLFVPGTRAGLLDKAMGSGASAVILDLEDAVDPGQRATARDAVVAALARPRRCPVLVRVNPADSSDHAADMGALAGAVVPDAVVLAKAEDPAALLAIRRRLRPALGLVALIESPAGLAAARALALQAERLAFGSIDYALSLGAAHRPDILAPARAELVLASALAGRAGPVDGVTTALRDPEALRADVTRARDEGFGGKLLIHPAQVVAALRGFAPDAETLAQARAVLASLGEDAGAQAQGGHMVDLPVIAAARRTVARAEAMARRIAESEGVQP